MSLLLLRNSDMLHIIYNTACKSHAPPVEAKYLNLA